MMTKKAGTCASPAALILDLGLQNVLAEVQEHPQSAIFASALLAES